MDTNDATGRRIKRGWMNLRVVEVHDETPDTKTFVFVDAEDGARSFDFIAGQYLTFRYDSIGPKPLVRSYTMSGSPCQSDAVYVTVKRIPGGIVSNWMCDEIKPGTILRARGPIGKFHYDASCDSEHLFMIAAGSGVTPFTSIIREYAGHLGEPEYPKSLSLLVAYRSQQDLINWDVLRVHHNKSDVCVRVSLTREQAQEKGFWQGRPDDAMLREFIGDRYGVGTFMTCGPQALMDLTSAHLLAAGVAPERIKTESFDS